MPTLAEIRQQYPQYADLDDSSLADGLYRKFYSDMPRAEFEKRLGIAAPVSGPVSSIGMAEAAADVAKSAGIGLAQGGIGLATLPGNIEQLGRLGINKGAEFVGARPPVSNETFLPTYSDAKSAIEGVTGKFYEPKTTAGEFARTAGEFASLAVGGPAGVANRVARVAVPAVASETAGQLTEGTSLEPWARLAGALAGPRIANVGATSAQRAVTPMPTSAERQAAVKFLENEGVTALTAGQKTGRRPLQWTESTLSDIPFAGKKANAMMEAQAEQFTQAALRRAGVNARRATPDVIDDAFNTLGQQFDGLAARNTMRVDQQFGNDLRTTVRDYFSVVPESHRAPVIQETVQDIIDAARRTGGTLSGEAYQALRSRLDTLRRRTISGDPHLSKTLGNLRSALDDAMERSAPAADAAAWQQARQNYRNLLTIEKAMSGAGENTALGLISPSQLRTAAKGQNKRAFVRGQDDLGPLARSGEAIMKPLPQSGTTPRAVAAGLIGGLSLTDPTMITSLLAPIAAGRTLMSQRVQNYLANQAVTSARRVPEASIHRRLAQSLMFPVEEPGLRGGIGPRYEDGKLRQ